VHRSLVAQKQGKINTGSAAKFILVRSLMAQKQGKIKTGSAAKV
jgi:hypothetical protein